MLTSRTKLRGRSRLFWVPLRTAEATVAGRRSLFHRGQRVAQYTASRGKKDMKQAGQGETAWRGSNKPRPPCNRTDMPTSICSFVHRKSMEPLLLRKANDDRRPSIGA